MCSLTHTHLSSIECPYSHVVSIFLMPCSPLYFISSDVSGESDWSFLNEEGESSQQVRSIGSSQASVQAEEATIAPLQLQGTFSHLPVDSPLSPTSSYTPPIGESFECLCKRLVPPTAGLFVPECGSDCGSTESLPLLIDLTSSDNSSESSDIEVLLHHC